MSGNANLIVEFYHIDAFEVPNYEPIWRSLRTQGVDARLVAVPGKMNTASAGWFDFDRFEQYCREHHLTYTTTADPNAHLAVTTQNIDILRNYRCPKVRLMYGPSLYPASWGLQAEPAKPFDLLLTHGKFYAEYYSNWLRREQLPVIGYPRYDDFFSGKLNRQKIRERWGVTEHKPVVVFLPTWGNNTAFDTFFPELLKLTQQYQIILRPHHCTLRMESQRMMMLKASGLLILGNAFDLAEVYRGADAVISDVRSGGLYEACLCNVPTVGMVIDPREMDAWISTVGIQHCISLCMDPKQLAFALEHALNSKEQSDNQLRWVEDFVAYRDGTAGQQAAQALIEYSAHLL